MVFLVGGLTDGVLLNCLCLLGGDFAWLLGLFFCSGLLGGDLLLVDSVLENLLFFSGSDSSDDDDEWPGVTGGVSFFVGDGEVIWVSLVSLTGGSVAFCGWFSPRGSAVPLGLLALEEAALLALSFLYWAREMDFFSPFSAIPERRKKGRD